MGYNEFKSKFLNDISQFENLKSKLPLFKSALDKAVEKELPLRDELRQFQIRDFTNNEMLKISYNSSYLMCKYSTEKQRVFVGTVSPSWSRGWKNISKDDFVSEQIDTFFYLARQYIYRGYQINLIGAIALTYGKHCDFRGDELREYQLPYFNSEYTASRNDIPIIRNKRNRKLAQMVDLINSFDPFVNKAIYYYVRSLSLLSNGYYEEALTAVDNAVDVILQAIKQQKHLPTMDRNSMYNNMNNEIHLPNGTVDQLKNLYQLRCSFSAHPAHSKWWDFCEIYERNIEAIMDAVKLVMIKFLIYEKNNRRIDKTPSFWSKWFLENCDTVYDAVWFHKLPPLNI